MFFNGGEQGDNLQNYTYFMGNGDCSLCGMVVVQNVGGIMDKPGWMLAAIGTVLMVWMLLYLIYYCK
jgi:hypothetical protein